MQHEPLKDFCVTELVSKTPRLNQLVLLQQFSKFIADIHCVYNLPTEFVVDRPTIVSPIQARIYRSRLLAHVPTGYLFRREESCVALCAAKHDWGKKTYEDVFLMEIFEDEGSDGHTVFCLQGLVPITNDTIRNLLGSTGRDIPSPYAGKNFYKGQFYKFVQNVFKEQTQCLR